MKKLVTIALLGLVVCAFTTEKAIMPDGGTKLSAELTGAAERPGPGDPDGSGWVELTLNQGQGTISYEIHVDGIAPAAAAHIHVGSPTMAGPVVVGLEPPTDVSVVSVVEVDAELIKAIRKNPGNYYVNVHNSQYPAGAVRGQLSK